jgi:hypothetical protein
MKLPFVTSFFRGSYLCFGFFSKNSKIYSSQRLDYQLINFNFQERFLLKCSILNVSSIKFNVQKMISKGMIKETKLFTAIIMVRHFYQSQNLLMVPSWLLVTENSVHLSKDLIC